MKVTTYLNYSRTLIFCLVTIFLSGCITVNLVQPYDSDLYSNTESFYKKASALIADGVSVSPVSNKERDLISSQEKEKHPGHYKQFKVKYDSLLIDANALILRALASSGRIDLKAQQIHTKIENAITKSSPGNCDDLQKQYSNVSLTVRNFLDLKCMIGNWEKQHNSTKFTGGKLILKKANWEARSKTLFDGIIAIQKAEASKKDK